MRKSKINCLMIRKQVQSPSQKRVRSWVFQAIDRWKGRRGLMGRRNRKDRRVGSSILTARTICSNLARPSLRRSRKTRWVMRRRPCRKERKKKRPRRAWGGKMSRRNRWPSEREVEKWSSRLKPGRKSGLCPPCSLKFLKCLVLDPKHLKKKRLRSKKYRLLPWDRVKRYRRRRRYQLLIFRLLKILDSQRKW